MNSMTDSRSIVFVVAHPDDVAHAMGGTAWLLREAYSLHVFCATKGERGIKEKSMAEAAAIREKEEEEACRHLKAGLTFLGQIDGEFFAGREVCERVAEKLQGLQPRAVFTLWPINRHPDHVAAHAVAYKAVQLAGLAGKTEFYMGENALEVTKQFAPDLLVDISAVVEEKKRLIRAHKSQNTTEARVERVLQRNLFRGATAGCAYAEAFKTPQPLLVPGAEPFRASVLFGLK